MNSRNLSVLVATLLLLSGCVPKYTTVSPMNEASVDADLEKSLDAIAQTDNVTLVSDWWTGYGDPQLNAILSKALTDAPSLKSIEERYAMANALTESIEAKNLPDVSTDTQLIRERFSEHHIFPAPLGGSTNTLYRPSLALHYDFDFWNERQSRILTARQKARAQKASIAAARLALTSAICDTYLAWNFDEHTLLVLEQMEKTVQKQLAVVSYHHRLGLSDATRINAYKSDLAFLHQRTDGIRRAIEVKKESICVLGGFLPSYADSLHAPTVQNAFSVPLPKEVVLNLLAHRPDVAAAKYEALASHHAIDTAKAQFYPNISLSGLLGFTSFEWSKLLTRSSYTPMGGIALSLPIFDGGEREANLQSSVSDYNRSVYDYNQAVIKAANEVVVLLKEQRLVESQLASHDAQRQALQENMAIARKKYALGLSDSLPYLGASIKTLESEIGALELESTKASVQIALIKALGGGYRDSTPDSGVKE